ncbi:E3 ubiquitin-protein ligase SINA-like 2 [Raphanus sativus]|nr:E3 ubiquitin-protein ligase SINA-like 2 [Raphanus sativus]KAJ4874676.1 E3 ubiquitin-protein ligase SINA-like 2 [Raphanus sativus]
MQVQFMPLSCTRLQLLRTLQGSLRHYHAYHLDTWKGFTCGENEDAWVEISEKILVLQERRDGQEGRDGPLVVVQCFEVEQGVYVTVNYIAPCAPGVSEFSFQLSYSVYGAAARSMPFGLGEMNRIQKVSFQTPDKDFISVPNYFLAGRTTLKMTSF